MGSIIAANIAAVTHAEKGKPYIDYYFTYNIFFTVLLFFVLNTIEASNAVYLCMEVRARTNLSSKSIHFLAVFPVKEERHYNSVYLPNNINSIF